MVPLIRYACEWLKQWYFKIDFIKVILTKCFAVNTVAEYRIL